MKITPYLTFAGDCAEAIELYKHAFNAEVLELMKFADTPPIPDFEFPAEFMDKIMQARLKFGDHYIRMSDCGPGHELNQAESERISINVEASIDEIKKAFNIFAEQGRVGMPLCEIFYSPCAGVVFDKFGVMWNLVGR